ncbi:MAG: phosphatase PAP2 family protein [Muribaculaceae bacterium]|nr:phosphatase PAP2 family protein [Muribaculaceae bacterium]
MKSIHSLTRSQHHLFGLPKIREAIACIAALAVWLTVTALFIGFRPEHIFLAILIGGLFFTAPSTRKLVVALIPFALFGISYDWMNLLPNYEVNPVDVRQLYETEKSLFGIFSEGVLLTPNEFFALHHHPIMDFFAGLFYLCWVPLPIFYGLWLYFSGKEYGYLRFALVFLLVNLIGFAGYYIHPAAPPWYVANHGFEPIVGTPGDVAGLGRFDDMTGLSVFHSLYTRNSNVFAAMPSLHSAYTFVAFIYSFIIGSSRVWKCILGTVTLGIWFTAVYTSHHYILDVCGGIVCSFIAVALFECVLMRIPPFRRWLLQYAAYITPQNKPRHTT